MPDRLRPILRFAASLLLLLAFWGVGELLSEWLRLSIPGNVVGMVLLTAALRSGLLPVEAVRPAAELLIRSMGLLFVPPGVALILYFDLIGREWPAIVGASVVSTVAVMLVVGRVQQGLEPRG